MFNVFGRLISDRMSYKNHYMCSGEATSTYNIGPKTNNMCQDLYKTLPNEKDSLKTLPHLLNCTF